MVNLTPQVNDLPRTLPDLSKNLTVRSPCYNAKMMAENTICISSNSN
jgi:hypothetical protein